MARALVRGAALLGIAGVAGVFACTFLWPERYAVNAPLGHLVFGRAGAVPDEALRRERLRAPEGLSIGAFALVPRARMLRVTPTGDLLVSVPRDGKIVLLHRDADGDGAADGAVVLLRDLDLPHGIDLHDGWLYVAEGDAVVRVRFDAETRSTRGPRERVVTGLPSGGRHWSRTLRFGPDGWMYVSVGSSCNACEEEDPRRAAILRFRPDGSEAETFATGLRNAVGFDWQPQTNALYATDNGRDHLGDDLPPCELDRVVKGGFYGWPFAYGSRVPDPDLGAGRDAEISSSVPPAHAFRAHTAPLGITFLRHQAEGSALAGAALVAQHGSWNRTRKDGYQVVALHWDDAGSIREEPFAWGFLEDEDVIGRPVDVAEAADGTIYVSDDYGGVIYRIGAGDRAAAAPPSAPTDAGPPPPAAPANPEALALGQALYERHACYGCHEVERTAPETTPVLLSGLAARYDAADLAAYLAAPVAPMPRFPLEPEERLALAAYLLARFGD